MGCVSLSFEWISFASIWFESIWRTARMHAQISHSNDKQPPKRFFFFDKRQTMVCKMQDSACHCGIVARSFRAESSPHMHIAHTSTRTVVVYWERDATRWRVTWGGNQPAVATAFWWDGTRKIFEATATTIDPAHRQTQSLQFLFDFFKFSFFFVWFVCLGWVGLIFIALIKLIRILYRLENMYVLIGDNLFACCLVNDDDVVDVDVAVVLAVGVLLCFIFYLIFYFFFF